MNIVRDQVNSNMQIINTSVNTKMGTLLERESTSLTQFNIFFSETYSEPFQTYKNRVNSWKGNIGLKWVNAAFSLVFSDCSKKWFLEVSQNSQVENCARVSFFFFIKRPATLLKKRLWHRWFPVNFGKFLRTPFFTEHPRWLFLCFSRCSKRC